MKAPLGLLLISILLLTGCATAVVDDRLWNPRPAALIVGEDIYFTYKPVMGWWNRAPAARYVFQTEDEAFIYYRLESGKVAYGSRFDAEKSQDGGLALSKTDDVIHVYVEDDYDKAMKGAGELPRAFVKRPSDGKFRAPFGALPASERRKIKMEPAGSATFTEPNKAPEPTLGLARSSQGSAVFHLEAGVAHL